MSPRSLSARAPSSSADAPSVRLHPECLLLGIGFKLTSLADKREFVKISQAVGMGVLIMVCATVLLHWFGHFLTVC